MPSVFIVGAGISGLALAYRLQQRLPAAEITVVEQRLRPGGCIWTERQAGFQLEIGPNGFLDTKPATLALCRDLGLGDRLLSGSDAAGKNRYLFLDGKLQLLPGNLVAFLRSNVLSWRGKLAVLAERFRRKGPADHDESIDAFVRRRAGGEAAEVLADAFVTGIYAGDLRLLSVAASFPRLVALEQEHGSIFKGFAGAARQRRREAAARGEAPPRPGKMWSFREGLRLLVEALTARLSRPPLLGVSAGRVDKRTVSGRPQPGWQVVADDGRSWSADAVVLTCPAYQQAALLAELDPALAERIGGIAYNRVAVVGLGYRQSDVPMSLDGFGFLTPGRSRRDLLGVQWCSSIYPDRAPAGMVLLRALCGGWHRPEMVGWDDARLREVVQGELRIAMGITAPPVFHRVIRWDRAIPQYHVGHLQRVAWIGQRAESHAGLFLAGNAYRGVALNDCTEQAELLAEKIAQYVAGVASG